MTIGMRISAGFEFLECRDRGFALATRRRWRLGRPVRKDSPKHRDHVLRSRADGETYLCETCDRIYDKDGVVLNRGIET